MNILCEEGGVVLLGRQRRVQQAAATAHLLEQHTEGGVGVSAGLRVSVRLSVRLRVSIRLSVGLSVMLSVKLRVGVRVRVGNSERLP